MYFRPMPDSPINEKPMISSETDSAKNRTYRRNKLYTPAYYLTYDTHDRDIL